MSTKRVFSVVLDLPDGVDAHQASFALALLIDTDHSASDVLGSLIEIRYRADGEGWTRPDAFSEAGGSLP